MTTPSDPESWCVEPLIACVAPFTVKAPLKVPVKVKLQVTWPPLPPPEQLSTAELFDNVALIAVLPSVERNVRVPPAIVNVPGGLATSVPPAKVPPELVKPPWSADADANANGMNMARHASAKAVFMK